MVERNSNIMEPIKRTFIIVVSVIFLILICFIYLQIQTRHNAYEDKIIINTFGKQRMYTQMISKDVSRLYALMQARETNYAYQPDDEINVKIESVKASLSEARDDFNITLQNLHKNEMEINKEEIPIESKLIISSKALKRIDALWVHFDEAVSVILSSDQIDENMANATIYINENNMELYKQCDSFLNEILKDSLRHDKAIEYTAYLLIGLLIFVLILSIYQLQRFLIQPFIQLYKGITDIGLNNYPATQYYPTKMKIMPIVSEIGDMFHKINSLISLIENINSNDSFMETLNFISSTFSPFIPYNYIGIGLITEDKKQLRASYGVSDDTIVGLPERIKGASWLISDTSLEKLLETGEVRIINDLEEYCHDKPMKPYNKVILEAGIRASITVPLIIAGEPMGMIFFSSSNRNVYTIEHVNFLRTIANSIAICLNQNILFSEMLYSSILALAKLAEARDEDTGEHLDRMSVYSRVIAEVLFENNIYTDEITLEYIDNIERFSPLHDIGKVGIRDGILLKPAKLSFDEFDEMKKHTTFGAEVLKAAEKNMQKTGKKLFILGCEIAEGHHEKWDGSGYPYGKTGTDIPLSARIVALADVFDALTSKRPYKDAFPLEMSIDIIKEGRGKHFDPVIVDAFMENFHRIHYIYNKFHYRENWENLEP